MSLTVCPADVVAAPVEVVWEQLVQPARYSEWADAQVERIEPEGPATAGQTIYLTSRKLGRAWHIVFKVEVVDAQHHQIGLHALFPFGLQMKPHISCAAIDATSCRVQYG
jgi:Polyketide cyclase / dehydrase and lipid transport